VAFEKPEQIQKRPFAQHGKQKRSEREIRLVEQRLERLPAAHSGQPHLPAPQRGAAREDFDVARLVGDLHGEQLQDFPEMRMDLRNEAGRYLQRGVFVFDQVSHHLRDGLLHLFIRLERLIPIDRGLRVPLRGDRLRIELRGALGPDPLFRLKSVVKGRPARLDRGAARGESPVGGRGRAHRVILPRGGKPGAFGPSPTSLRSGAAHNPRHELAVAFHKFVSLLATPAAQGHGEIRRRGPHAEPAPDGQVAQRLFQKQMRAGRERERLNIDSPRR
jgi:hypothetical protein